jgi:phosphoserine phosphatase
MTYAKKEGINLANSRAVGGRLEDSLLLELTGESIMLNPDRAASDLATIRGWEIIRV